MKRQRVSSGVLAPTICFAASVSQRSRIQPREDASRSIVLSAQRYLTSSPGLTKNDATILPK